MPASCHLAVNRCGIRDSKVERDIGTVQHWESSVLWRVKEFQARNTDFILKGKGEVSICFHMSARRINLRSGVVNKTQWARFR